MLATERPTWIDPVVIAAWTAAGLPTTTEVPMPTPKTFKVDPGAASILVDLEGMKAAVADTSKVKLDTRDVDEWVAESSSPSGAPSSATVPPAAGREMRVVLVDPLAAADPELPRLVFLPLPDGVGLLLLELDDPRAPDLPPGLHGRAALHVRWLPNDRRSLDAVLRVADLRPGAAWSTPDGRLRLHFVGLAADGSGSLLVDRR